MPERLEETVSLLEGLERAERIDALIGIAERFREVPERLAKRPFAAERRVPACESEAYVWSETAKDGALAFHFAVENPQGISAKAMAALLAEGLEGVPAAEVYDVLSTPEGVDRAFAKLDEIKNDIVWWKSGAQPLQFIGSGEVDYAFGYTGRIIRAKDEGADYEMNWNTLVYSVDYWAAVKGSPKTQEAMELIDWITDAGPLREQANVYPSSPANKEINQDPEIRAKNPGMVLNHADEGLFISTEFWIANGDDLEARFTSWAAQ